MEAAYGKYGYYLLSLLQFMYPFLAMISYNVVVGDTLSKVLVRFFPSWGSSMGAVRLGVVFFVTVGVVVPLCLYKNVSRLARASFISLACVVFILFAVIIKLLSGDYKMYVLRTQNIRIPQFQSILVQVHKNAPPFEYFTFTANCLIVF